MKIQMLSLIIIIQTASLASYAGVIFGREKLKGTTGTMSISAEQGQTAEIEFTQRHKLPNRFSFELDGVALKGVTSIQGVGHDTNTADARNGDNGGRRNRPGVQKPGVMTVEREWTEANKEWFAWRQSVIEGRTQRKSVSVIFHNDAGEETLRIDLMDGSPLSYSGPDLNSKSSGHATEKIEISYETMDWK